MITEFYERGKSVKSDAGKGFLGFCGKLIIYMIVPKPIQE
jgi:hypothetical protein